MRIKYDKVRRNPKQLLSLTGFNLSAFKAFLLTFKYHCEEYHSNFTLKDQFRLHISYGRKSSQLPCIKDNLLFILSYMKNDPLQDCHVTIFEMTQPQCNERIHRISGILLRTLETLGKLPHSNHLRVKYLAEQCNNIFVDGTERPIKSPQDSDRQKSCYSSKKNSLPEE